MNNNPTDQILLVTSEDTIDGNVAQNIFHNNTALNLINFQFSEFSLPQLKVTNNTISLNKINSWIIAIRYDGVSKPSDVTFNYNGFFDNQYDKIFDFSWPYHENELVNRIEFLYTFLYIFIIKIAIKKFNFFRILIN